MKIKYAKGSVAAAFAFHRNEIMAVARTAKRLHIETDGMVRQARAYNRAARRADRIDRTPVAMWHGLDLPGRIICQNTMVMS